MHKSLVYVIDAVLVVGTLALVLWAFSYAHPVLNAPSDGFTTTGAVLFSFENGNTLLIDDNPAFTSPDRIPVHDQALITLDPGVHYWRVEGTFPSETRQITVDSLVELRVRASEHGYDIINGGSTRLSVDVYNRGTLTSNIILDPATSGSASGDRFIGRQAP